MNAVARWVIARLEVPCPDACDNGRLPNTEALAAREARLAEIRSRDSWKNRGPSWNFTGDGIAFYEALEQVPSETRPCPTCSGNGVVLTDAGRAALDFLNCHGGTR